MFHYDLAAFFSGLFKLQGGIALPLVTPWRQDNQNDDNNDNDSKNDSNNEMDSHALNSNNNNNNNNKESQQSELDYPYNRLSLLLPTSMIGDINLPPNTPSPPLNLLSQHTLMIYRSFTAPLRSFHSHLSSSHSHLYSH